MSCQDICVTMDFEADAGSLYSERYVQRARKEHRCIECGEGIPLGAKYHNASGLWHGAFFSERTCLPCAEIRSALVCGGFLFGELWDSIRDQVFPDWTRNELHIIDCLAKLSSDEAIAKMRAEYADYREALDS